MFCLNIADKVFNSMGRFGDFQTQDDQSTRKTIGKQVNEQGWNEIWWQQRFARRNGLKNIHKKSSKLFAKIFKNVGFQIKRNL